MSLSAGALGATVGPRWTPLELGSQLAGWWDASDSTTITNVSGAASQWDDKSGNGRHLAQATAGSRPTIQSANQNGLDTLQFKSSRSMSVTLGSAITGTRLAAFAVAYQDGSASNYGRLVTTFASSGSDYNGTSRVVLLEGRLAASNQIAIEMNSSVPVTPTFTRNQWNVAAGLMDGTSAKVRVNGTESSGTFGSTPSLSVTKVYVGTGYLSPDNFYWNSPVAEVVLLTGEVTTAQAEQLEAYLAWKWGISGNLPAGHPYKNIRP